MHNYYFIEVDNQDLWKCGIGLDKRYIDFDEAVEKAKTLIDKHDSVRVVDECYGRVWWRWQAYHKPKQD